MSTVIPKISVVIPAYNQARFLSDAIQSVLVQTYRDFEIIVVDDGSTDDTAVVAQQIGSAIRYFYQDNRGLAGARNTGIRQSQSEYVALLDCDDQWLPSFLETMMFLVEQNPDAAAYYCGWRYMDVAGCDLPQAPNSLVIPPEQLYQVLLRANFIVPSAVILHRSKIVQIGLFDETLRQIEDWDLWIRLLRNGYPIVGSPKWLLRYRLHGSSLSDSVIKMQRTLQAVVEKHFGEDDRQWEKWSWEKRRAFGGVYRYNALTSVLRQNDWQRCAEYLRQAFQVDPTLAADLDLFYELALGTQPLGYRGVFETLDFESNTRNLLESMQVVFLTHPMSKKLEEKRSEAYGYAYLALGLVAYGCRRMSESRYYLLKSVCAYPLLIYHPQISLKLLKSFLGARLLDTLKERLVDSTAIMYRLASSLLSRK